MSSASPCIHSFHYLQDALLPDFLLLRSVDSRGPSMASVKERISRFAAQNPIKFVALSTFLVLGGIPIIGFLAYAVATVIASLIGAIILELILLGIGITGLAFVLFFVTCITLCATSIFVSLYYSYQIASKTWSQRALRWPVRSRTNPMTETHSSTEEAEETDKTK